MPAKATACGLPPPSLLIAKEAERLPWEEGVNVILTWQLADGANALPQVPDLEKSPALGPRSAICQRVTGALLELATMMDWAALGVPTC